MEHHDRVETGESVGVGAAERSGADAARWLSEHGDSLWRFAMHHLDNADAAEDLVQEALLAAWKSRGTFADQSSERTWLIGVLRHKILDHWRRERRRAGMLRLESAYDERGLWRETPRPWVSGGVELASALEQCLSRLPGSLRRAFEMVEVRGCSTSHVAESLGLTKNNLWVRLHRARLMLRACVDAALGSERPGGAGEREQ